MNINIFNKLIKEYFTLENLFYKKIIEVNIDKEILFLLESDNIKNKAKNIYNKLKSQNKNIITILDKEYPKVLLDKISNIPFCIICDRKINFNNKNIYIYFKDYFSKYGIKVLNYFIKIFSNNNCNVFSKYKEKCLKIKYISISNINEYNFKENCYIYISKLYMEIFLKILNCLVIIEAKYEEEAIKLVDTLLQNNKDIYVVPSNIFNKNSYFSNYLIKQGADILLNKQDIKFIISRKRIY